MADSLRTAVERTLAATAGSAVTTRERAGALLDEVAQRSRDAGEELARRGQSARDELGKRGQRTGAGLARRGNLAVDEVLERLDRIEERLGSIEGAVRHRARPKAEG